MFKKILIAGYRVIMILLIFTPPLLNAYFKADIIVSLLFIPIVSLLLSYFAILFDKKLNTLILPKIKLQTFNQQRLFAKIAHNHTDKLPHADEAA